MTALPEPLVPAEVDLRGYEFMPYYGDRLRDSELNSRATDAEYRAAHNLWWSSWRQVPASSVPNNDVELARLADLGRDLKAWAKVKERALHGFVLCSDGRYYHRVLAPLAIEAFEFRKLQRARTEAARLARQSKRQSTNLSTGGGGDQSQNQSQAGKHTVTEKNSPSDRIKTALSQRKRTPVTESTGQDRTVKELAVPKSGAGGGNGHKVKGDEILQVKTPDTPDVERNRRVAAAAAAGNVELAKQIKAGALPA